MKIAVTGASGQLGASIVKELLTELNSDQVIAFARTPEKAKQLGVEVRNGDYNVKSHFEEGLKDIDAVLLLSASGNPMDRIPQHRNVIEAAKASGVKKIVYTSVSGNFGKVVESNHQTEADVRESGLDWAIGRNGIYIEPDVEYIETYKKEGKIANCAGEGKCGYTTRGELAVAYKQMLLEEKHNGNLYQLTGEAITQAQLAEYMNQAFGTNLIYEPMSVEAYKAERTEALGEFMGGIIAAIYGSIRNGDFDVKSNYEAAAGRPHITWDDYFRTLV